MAGQHSWWICWINVHHGRLTSNGSLDNDDHMDSKLTIKKDKYLWFIPRYIFAIFNLNHSMPVTSIIFPDRKLHFVWEFLKRSMFDWPGGHLPIIDVYIYTHIHIHTICVYIYTLCIIYIIVYDV